MSLYVVLGYNSLVQQNVDPVMSRPSNSAMIGDFDVREDSG